MPRYDVMQRRKAQKDLQRRWELAAGSRVWCYLRHSPGDNQTIDGQRAGMQHWCAENGWGIARMFTDEALEGSREDRDQFQLMMSLARQEPRLVDGIVLWSFSRFARDQLDAQFYKAELRKRGYAIISKIDDIPNNEMAPIYEAFIDWKNQRFHDDLSADVKRGLMRTVEQGYWPGGTLPFGYLGKRVEIGRRHGGEPRYGLRVMKDEAVAERVALAWKMKLRENASYLEIHGPRDSTAIPSTTPTSSTTCYMQVSSAILASAIPPPSAASSNVCPVTAGDNMFPKLGITAGAELRTALGDTA